MQLISRQSSNLLGEINVPGDKSISHRAALLSALAIGESRLENFLVSGVTEPILAALRSLGVHYDHAGTTVTIQGGGLEALRSNSSCGKAHRQAIFLNCGTSATSMRLLTGFVAAAGRAAVLDGSAGLRRRPMARIITPLTQMGVRINSQNGYAPLKLSQDKERRKIPELNAIHYELPVASAQVKSCIILAALAAKGETVLVEPGPSRDHTERLLRAMGVSVQSEYLETPVETNVDRFFITRIKPVFPFAPSPLRLAIPGDFSSAAFLIVAALVTPGSLLTLKNVGLNPTRTGLLDVLFDMGAKIRIDNRDERHGEPIGDVHIISSQLSGVDISGDMVVRMIDEFPIFAVAAACANGLSRVRDAQELRVKESDRITALVSGLRRLGIQTAETGDGFSVLGKEGIAGGEVDSVGDHRLAMAFTVAGLAAKGDVTVTNAEVMAESYPGFVDALITMGANLVIRE